VPIPVFVLALIVFERGAVEVVEEVVKVGNGAVAVLWGNVAELLALLQAAATNKIDVIITMIVISKFFLTRLFFTFCTSSKSHEI